MPAGLTITMSTATSQAAPLSAYAIQVDPRDNVAVARVPVPRGTQVQVGPSTVDVLDDVTPGHRFALAAIAEGDFVRQYGQPIGTSKGVAAGALISRANMSNDVPVVRELDARPAQRGARLRARGRARDVHGLPPPGRPRRHPQLGADRADQHVRGARGRADRHGRRVHALRQGEVPQRRRRRRHPAQQGLRLLGRLQHRGHAAHAGRVCRPPQRRRRGLHRARLREDQPDGDGAVPQRPAPRRSTSPSRASASRRPAARRDRSSAGSRPSRRCCRWSTRITRTPAPDQRALDGRQVRRVGRLLRAVGQPGARARRRRTGSPGRHRADHRGARVLRRRAHPRVARQGRRDRPRRLRDGRLVQGLRGQVRHRAEREPEPRQRRRRPAQHHHQVARRHRQGRHHARRGRGRLRRAADGPRPVPDAGPGLRPGVDAGPDRLGRAARGLHHRPRHDHRQRHRAGAQAGVQQRRCTSG